MLSTFSEVYLEDVSHQLTEAWMGDHTLKAINDTCIQVTSSMPLPLL
jgi:hypothetical protein